MPSSKTRVAEEPGRACDEVKAASSPAADAAASTSPEPDAQARSAEVMGEMSVWRKASEVRWVGTRVVARAVREAARRAERLCF